MTLRIARLTKVFPSGLRRAMLAWAVAISSLLGGTPMLGSTSSLEPRATVYLPMVIRVEPCQPIADATYLLLSADPPGPHLPPAAHPDLNLSVRGYEAVDAYRGLLEYTPETDPLAPQLAGLFRERRLPAFCATYQVHDWDWAHTRRGPLIAEPPVTALGLATTEGETLHVPDSGYTIGSDCEVLVLYADATRITLKYTREDNVVYGYTLHVDNICVDPTLLTLYQQCDAAGRSQLPALRPHQAFAYARSSQVVIAVVDSGTFMDPRSRRDWWMGF